MFRKIIVVLILICLSTSLFALDLPNAEPYKDGEFPKWSLKLRRGEIIFFGSLPLTYTFTTLAMSIAKSDASFGKKIGIACSVSAAIALVDFIIGEVNK